MANSDFADNERSPNGGILDKSRAQRSPPSSDDAPSVWKFDHSGRLLPPTTRGRLQVGLQDLVGSLNEPPTHQPAHPPSRINRH